MTYYETLKSELSYKIKTGKITLKNINLLIEMKEANSTNNSTLSLKNAALKKEGEIEVMELTLEYLIANPPK